MKRSRARGVARLGIFGVLLTAIAVSCRDVQQPHDHSAGAMQEVPGTNFVYDDCGLAFRVHRTSVDSELLQYGPATSVDSSIECETWTGNDYTYQDLSALNNTDFGDTEVADTTRTSEYAAGHTTGYASDGGVVAEPESVGVNAFDAFHADSATIQASYDDPYWAIYAQDCRPADCPIMLGVRQLSVAAADSVDSRFGRYGIMRRGVRALMESADEMTSSSPANRRFHRRVGDADMDWEIERETGLLLSETARFADGREVQARHGWKRVPTGFLRSRTVVDEYRPSDGRLAHTHTEVTISDVRAHGQPLDP